VKSALIVLNIILALLLGRLVFDIVDYSTEGSSAGTKQRVVKKSKSKNKGNAKGSAAEEEKKSFSAEEQKQIIVENDVFNPLRSPNSLSRGRNDIDMKLIGIFTVGETSGAIIVQSKIERQVNPFMPQAVSNPSGGGGVQRFSSIVGYSSATNRQYVKVGDTLLNGYTLVEVSRNRAVLTRGGEKMELELQSPSQSSGLSSRTSRQRRMSTSEQLQQAQMATQVQMLRLMRQMQGGNRSSRGGR
jgi:hypothetical protein